MDSSQCHVFKCKTNNLNSTNLNIFPPEKKERFAKWNVNNINLNISNSHSLTPPEKTISEQKREKNNQRQSQLSFVISFFCFCSQMRRRRRGTAKKTVKCGGKSVINLFSLSVIKIMISCFRERFFVCARASSSIHFSTILNKYVIK